MRITKKFAKDGGRTHAHIRESDLKSDALTTRPPGLANTTMFKLLENTKFKSVIRRREYYRAIN